MAASDGCPLGLRIFTRIERPDPADLTALRALGPCDISDIARGSGVADSGIRPLWDGMPRVFGPAVTVDLTPGDGLLLRAAVDAAEPGDVIVVNGRGEVQRALLGGVIAMHMVHRGVAGLVVDGAVRDVAEFRELGLPVMARGVTPRSGTTSSGWGEVNVPVALGGAVVMPGDVVVGDAEGLVVVPRRWAGRVAAALSASGHPPFAPGLIRGRLDALEPDAPVLGLDRVHRAVAERTGAIIEASYESDPGGGL